MKKLILKRLSALVNILCFRNVSITLLQVKINKKLQFIYKRDIHIKQTIPKYTNKFAKINWAKINELCFYNEKIYNIKIKN